MKTLHNPWPLAIIVWFILFAGGIAVWVTFAVHQKNDLVRQDYYEEEIRYQQHIDQQNRTSALRSPASIAYDAARQLVTIQLPPPHTPNATAGRVHFYRPSNASLDHEIPLALDADGLQRIPAEKLRAGLWKIRVHWTANGEEYFIDQSVAIIGGRS